MKLQLGKMRTEDLATWFNIKYGTFRKNPSKYFSLLENYCDYERVHGGVIISQIYYEVYEKDMNLKDEKMYMEEVVHCVDEHSGLSTLAGMARKFENEGRGFSSPSTGKRRLGAAGKRLFGDAKNLTSYGVAGTREYVWAIRIDEFNTHRLMTEEEEKLFDDIISSCFSANPDKIKKLKLIEDQLRHKEINSDEYFDIKDKLNLNLFTDCIFLFKEKTGHMIVKASRHELNEVQTFK